MKKALTLSAFSAGFVLLTALQPGFAGEPSYAKQSALDEDEIGRYEHPSTEKRSFSNKDLRGTYATSFEGEVVGVGPIASVGWINPDGKGNIPRAVRTISVNGVPVAAGVFTCTYSVRHDGTGSAACTTDEPAAGFPETETFDFVLEDKGNGFRFVGTTPAVVILGTARRQ